MEGNNETQLTKMLIIVEDGSKVCGGNQYTFYFWLC